MLKEAEKLITDMSHKAADAELPNFLSHTHATECLQCFDFFCL
jgi:hypothetical protein